MIIENSEALKLWLITNLNRICNADPAALAKYVLALVKKDKPQNELREFCSDQLEVFLLKETKLFVDLLFETLKNKSYLLSGTDVSADSINSNTSLSVAPSNADQHCVVDEVIAVNKITSTENDKCKDDASAPRKSISPINKSNRSKDADTKKRGIEDDKNRDLFSKKSKTRKHDHYSKAYKDIRDKDDRRDKYFKDKESISHSSRKDFPFKSRSRSSSYDSSRSRGSSRSRSSSSRSRSKERLQRPESKNYSKSHLHKHNPGNHGDRDYRQKLVSVLKPVQPQISKQFVSKRPLRCLDYDEKGFCLRGEMCLYDHGTDPILVDDVSVLNFGVPVSDSKTSKLVLPDGKVTSKSSLPPLPAASPPPLPPPPPPLPPLPPPGYVPEPYNPEAPGMNLSPRDHLNYWPPLVHHLPPPHLPSLVPSGNIPNVLFNINEPPPTFHNNKLIRTRELIGVPTVSSSELEKHNNEPSVLLQSLVVDTDKFHVSRENDDKRKGFDFGRLGPLPRKPTKSYSNRTTLEIRKIPKNLNTISMLNDHFSKFGRIVNLQVSYDSDPEAALIQFLTNAEATAAYRSTAAVLNNRFIKVFWHNKNEKNNHSVDIKQNISPSAIVFNEKHVESSDFKNVVMQNDVLKNNSTGKKNDKILNNTPKATFPHNVFSSASLKKSSSGSRPATAKQKEELRKNALLKKMELYRKKQKLQDSEIKHQKIILEKFSKCKNEKEKLFLKQTLKVMTARISNLQNEVKRDSENMKTFFKLANNKSTTTKTETEKELLDAEMDLYNKQHSGDDTAELLSKVTELKQKAKALGLIDNFPPHKSIGQACRSSKTKFLPKARLNLQRTVDHRPKKIVVSGSTEKSAVLNHLSQFGNVESVIDGNSGFIVTFNTRLEAEAAFSLGSKMGENTLSLAWICDSHPNVSNSAQVTDLVDSKSETLQADEEDDEDEDNEDRSWRR